MKICIREFEKRDLEASLRIWNQVIEDGVAFPSMEILDPEEGLRFFREQTYTGVAENTDTGEILGLYILHPNNVGRCGHISNTSYAVLKEARGNGIGEKLVLDSLRKARECGFRILQFNAVVGTNHAALQLYKKLGFVRLGVIPGGFLMKDGHYEDIILHYYLLEDGK